MVGKVCIKRAKNILKPSLISLAAEKKTFNWNEAWSQFWLSEPIRIKRPAGSNCSDNESQKGDGGLVIRIVRITRPLCIWFKPTLSLRKHYSQPSMSQRVCSWTYLMTFELTLLEDSVEHEYSAGILLKNHSITYLASITIFYWIVQNQRPY